MLKNLLSSFSMKIHKWFETKITFDCVGEFNFGFS